MRYTDLLNIVTAADRKYFKFVPRFMQQVQTVFPEARMVLYDLGMSSHQLGLINYFMVKYKPWRTFKGRGEYPEGYIPRALHKPSMLLNAARKFEGPIIYMDVDAIPVNYFVLPDCDVAVTMKSQETIAQYANTPLEEYLGYLDAGVIMLGPDEKRELFLADWVVHMGDDKTPSDQKSLNKIVGRCHDWTEYNVTKDLEIGDETLRIRILHEDDYNSSSAHPMANIIHLKVHEQ